MSRRLSLDELGKTVNNRESDQESKNAYFEKTGDPAHFRKMVEMDRRARNRPGYWVGAVGH
jgi:hypothetical protein